MITPGEWKIEGPFKHGVTESRYEVVAENGVTVALCAYPRGDEEARAVAEADAKLIAAAPKMAEALKHARMLVAAADLRGGKAALAMYDAVLKATP